MIYTPDQAKQFIEFAPPLDLLKPSPTGLRGFETSNGHFYCSDCTIRISHRGIFLTGSLPVWSDKMDKARPCDCCGKVIEP